MKTYLLLAALVVISLKGFSQDLLITFDNDSIYCEVVGFDGDRLKYKLNEEDFTRTRMLESLDWIIYENGERINPNDPAFDAKQLSGDEIAEVPDTELEITDALQEITDTTEENALIEEVVTETGTSSFKGDLQSMANHHKRVYVKSNDRNAIIHTKNSIQHWGHWQITTNRDEADFILNVNIRFMPYIAYKAYAQFIDPKTNKIVYSTREIESSKEPGKFDVNQKRSAINVLFDEEIKPKFR